MSFIQEPDAPHVDAMGAGPLLDQTRITRPVAVQAVATLHQHEALDLMAPLGLWAYFKEESP